MEIGDKLDILADAAKYDVSCSSSGSARANDGGLGNGHKSGICHTWTADGRCVSLLKILMTNSCIFDCEYCVNRRSHDTPRAILTPEEIVLLTVEFYKRNYIEGLFLSSGILRSPDYTTELLIRVAKLLREREHFNGYIHMKGIPGTDPKLLNELGRYVDRVSVNIELPSEKSLHLLAPQKTKKAILAPMKFFKESIEVHREEKKHHRKLPSFVPAGQTTQLIVGASGESDRQILLLTEELYQKASLKRVYYSAYVPVMKGKNLPALIKPPLARENRLYQADWLLRFYKFRAEEILTPEEPDFDEELDPKCTWALRHRELFPVEINRAPYEMILRVPGIGVRSALRIVRLRRYGGLSYDHLKRIGVVLKRARYFMTVNGRYYGEWALDSESLRNRLISETAAREVREMSLFDTQT
ncbi:putative DNA modification/repair radical SAM protein [uncultured Dialister sp.]|uniref:putative DNA modification/repair radical SAM protein n=1 Tax=uncultured Dialister sp. TaxID=278064 RepID=UPI0025CF1C56|nr:putative DNA modification/repair radical SAM protein [uncultured Dialister sp.]